MSSDQKDMLKLHKPLNDQDWVIHITRSLEEEIEDLTDDVPVSIFTVPKSLCSIKPEAYIPQIVALGPYHHRRLELFEMERYKLTSARRVQKELKNIKLKDLVTQFEECQGVIRASYHKVLDFDRLSLSWMFALDSCFLLEFLQTYVAKSEGSLTRLSSKMAHLIDYTQRKTTHNAILRDIVMLENQIPFFVLREVHKWYQHDNPDRVLASMIMGFCKHLSPIKNLANILHHEGEECFRKSHLLELLYYMVAPNLRVIEETENCENAAENEEYGCFTKAFKSVWLFLCYINLALIHCLAKIVKSKPLLLVLKLPWTIIKLLCNVNTQSSTTNLLSSAESVVEEAESATQTTKDQSLLIEEFLVPNVTELSEIGVKFRPSKGGLNTIKFDKSCGTFYLPVMDLDDNSEVVLRNLVAYEASIAPEIFLITRFSEFMNGIVDTAEDVKILRESGIILNHLKSDEEVANLWNGMTQSVKMTKVPMIDKAIEDVNGYYSGRWKVRMKDNMKKYVFRSWPFLTLLAANLLILMTTLQAFCSMYSCSKWVAAL